MDSSRVGYPNYNAPNQLDIATKTYTAPYNGWIIFNIKFDRSSHASINIGNYNAYIGRSGADDSHGRWFGLPIKKGQVITWDYSGAVYVYFMSFA